MSDIVTDKEYKKGTIIWGKLRGFPWWPGLIQRVNNKHKYT